MFENEQFLWLSCFYTIQHSWFKFFKESLEEIYAQNDMSSLTIQIKLKKQKPKKVIENKKVVL